MIRSWAIVLASLLCIAQGCKNSQSDEAYKAPTEEAKPAGVLPSEEADATSAETAPGGETEVLADDAQADLLSASEAESQAPAAQAAPSAALKTEAGNVNVEWIHGSAVCSKDKNPPLQIHRFNKNLVILRQNKCLNFEAPFLYLVFGTQKALLLDTGATASSATFPVRQTVENLVKEHYGAANRSKIQLVVAHSHGHGDHRAADAQFQGTAATVLVGTKQTAVASFFKIKDFPNQIVDFDLGGRILKIIPLPGHEASSIAVYDAQTGVLFSGDSLYPGRLLIQDFNAYRASISRLNSFLKGKVLTFILGAHVEMSKTPGKDFAAGSTFQPNEHPLPLFRNALSLLDSELKAMGSKPKRKVLGEFIISPRSLGL